MACVILHNMVIDDEQGGGLGTNHCIIAWHLDEEGFDICKIHSRHRRNRKSNDILQFEEWFSWSTLGIERPQSSLNFFIYTNFAFYCVWHFSKFLVDGSSSPNPKHCDHFLLLWYLWLVICLQQGWRLLLLHLASVSLCWFVHYCVWGDFEITTILFAFGNENIPMLHAIKDDHQAWNRAIIL